MFFRNATIFTVPEGTCTQLRKLIAAEGTESLGGLLAECQLKPVGPLELNSSGMVSPFGEDSEELYHASGDCIWFTVGSESRILPGSVVNKALAKKISEIEQKEGRKPGGRERKRIKDELITDMLPKAFVKPGRVDAYVDLTQGVLVVDASSRKSAENVASEIRRVLGSFPALPLNAEVAPRSVMTGWIAGEVLPDGLELGDECVLADPVDSKAQVRCLGQELRSDEINKHLEAGKQVARVALTLDDHVSALFGEDLVVRKLKLLDGAVEALESTDREDLRAELDARFALLTGEVRRLFTVLKSAFRLSDATA